MKKSQKIARMNSKMEALKQIISHDSEDDYNEKDAKTSPIIVKVESMQSSVAAEPNVCGECGIKVSSSTALKRHLLLHKEPTFPCPECSLKFARPDYVERHMRKTHK